MSADFLSPKLPQVALLVETSREFGRSILLGVERYAKAYGPWTFHFYPGDFSQHLRDARTWNVKGVIARINSEDVANELLASRLPLVALDMQEEQRGVGCPFENTCEVRANSFEIGAMAAGYYLRAKYENYAFIGDMNNSLWSRQREEGFAARVHEAGKEIYTYRPPRWGMEWKNEIQYVASWLNELPKPVGILAAMDVRGRQVITVCQEQEIFVPEQVEVLGVDNDPLICRMCTPALSSIAMDIEEGGFQAARMLDALMRHSLKKKEVYQIDPTRIVERESTKGGNISDHLVVQALRFIRHAPAPTVQNVANYTGVSRRTLEMRFHSVLNRSVHQEIIQTRLDRVKNLLWNTNLNIAEIARQCEFCSEFYLHRFFLREAGITIRQFRDHKNLDLPERKKGGILS